MFSPKSVVFGGLLWAAWCVTAKLNATAAEKQPEPVEVKIINVETGKVLAPQGDSGEEAAPIALAEDNNSTIRQWRLEKDEHGYKLRNNSAEHLLDVFGAHKDEETPIIQWPEKSAESAANTTEGVDNQRWVLGKFDLENPKPLRIQSKFTELVLDVNDSGSIVQRKPDENAKSQLWKIVSVHPTQYFMLVNANTGWVLALESDAATSGGRAVLAKKVSSSDKNFNDRQWKLAKENDVYTFAHRPSGLVLNVPDGSKEEDHPVSVAESKSENADSQRWIWVGGASSKDKPLRLKSKASGLVLDVDDDGNLVQRAASDSAKSQLWLLVGEQ
ncbi:MAG TPA: RICIN domain-containing protein [Pirellulales bacterium]|jgi:hypothetical protein|nr:RICIN domain-containing protein [Pirellulales bacterium]